jgi:hypothetical protein
MPNRRHFSCLLLLLPLAVRSAPAPGSTVVPNARQKPGVSAEANPGASTASGSTRQTTEPQPPLAIAAETTSLQKNIRGGVVSVVLKVTAGVPLDEAVVSARTPSKVVFADGSTARTWKVDLASGGTASVPVEVIVSEDGKYSLSIEVTGKAEGKAVRRALSHKLYVGVKDRKAKDRDGANEYPAVEAQPAAETQPEESGS